MFLQRMKEFPAPEEKKNFVRVLTLILEQEHTNFGLSFWNLQFLFNTKIIRAQDVIHQH